MLVYGAVLDRFSEATGRTTKKTIHELLAVLKVQTFSVHRKVVI